MTIRTPTEEKRDHLLGGLLAILFVGAVIGAVYWLLAPGPVPSEEQQIQNAVRSALKERPRLLRSLRNELERHRTEMEGMITKRAARAYANASPAEKATYSREFRRAYRARNAELKRHDDALADLGFDEKSAREYLRTAD